MIRIFNSAVYEDTGAERLIPLKEASIIEQKLDASGRPFIFFEHNFITFSSAHVPIIYIFS